MTLDLDEEIRAAIGDILGLADTSRTTPGAARPSEAQGTERTWLLRLSVAAVAVGLVLAGLFAINRHEASKRTDSASSSSVTPSSQPDSTADSTVTTSRSTPAPSTTVPTEASVFRMTDEYLTLSGNARELMIRRCMTGRGFTYQLYPFGTSDEARVAAAAAWDDWLQTQSASTAGFADAYFGPNRQGGGCLDQAVAELYGPVRAEVFAEGIRSKESVGWQTTAWKDAQVADALRAAASCVRSLGYDVADPDVNPKAAASDLRQLYQYLMQQDPTLAEDPTPGTDYMRLRDAADKVCPDYGRYMDTLATATSAAEQAWVTAHPTDIAIIQREIDDDMARFRWVIEHDGDTPQQ